MHTDDAFNRPMRSLSRLFRGITANNIGDFYCLGCLHSFLKDNYLKNMKDYVMLKAPLTIYADLECLLIKEQSCQNNPNESYTETKAKHEPSGYTLSLISSFDSKETKHNVYRGRDCVKRFCSDLKELVTKIINFDEK